MQVWPETSDVPFTEAVIEKPFSKCEHLCYALIFCT